MQQLLEACLGAPGCQRQRQVLQRIVADPEAHPRLLNTLSRLEYVGVRKMLKARRAEDLDLDGLQHLLEEAVHAVRLKRFASNLAPDREQVRTFDDAHTLAGDAAERYFQAVDQAAVQALGGATPGGAAPDACYLMTSAAIEIRAECFYPAYQAVLVEQGHAVSVASIINDERDHLEEMFARLPTLVADWETRLASVMQAEERAFCLWLDAVEAALSGSAPRSAGGLQHSLQG